MRTADPDLHETFAPLREVEPTPEDIARVLALADELRSPRSLAPPRRRTGRAVALVAATAAVIGAIAALPGGEDSSRPQDAHGVFQAAAAVAAEQPAPAAYRYTRALERFVYGVNARRRPARPRDRGSRPRRTGPPTAGRDGPPARRGLHVGGAAERRAAAAAGDIGAVVKAYDGDYRYGDGPLARVPFAAIPADAAAAGALLEAAIRDGRWMADAQRPPALGAGRRRERGDAQRGPAAGDGQPHEPQRQALFGLLGTRPGRAALGQVTDATGRSGRRRGAAPARPWRRTARDHRPRDERHPAEHGGHGPAAGQPPEAAGGRAQAAVAPAGLAGRAHPGLPEHGQRRGARGSAVGPFVRRRSQRCATSTASPRGSEPLALGPGAIHANCRR